MWGLSPTKEERHFEDWVPQGTFSGTEISVQEVCWGVLWGITPVREWRKKNWAEGKSSWNAVATKLQPIPWALDLKWPFRVVLNWEKRARPWYTHMNPSLDTTDPRGVMLDEAGPFGWEQSLGRDSARNLQQTALIWWHITASPVLSS